MYTVFRSIFWIIVMAIITIIANGAAVPGNNSANKKNSQKKPRKPREKKYPAGTKTARRNTVGAIVRDGHFIAKIEPSVIVKYRGAEPTDAEIRDAWVEEFQKFAHDKTISETDVKKSGEKLYVERNGVQFWISEWHSSQRCKLCAGLISDPAPWCNDAFHTQEKKTVQKKRRTGF